MIMNDAQSTNCERCKNYRRFGHLDPNNLQWYCEECWIEFAGKIRTCFRCRQNSQHGNVDTRDKRWYCSMCWDHYTKPGVTQPPVMQQNMNLPNYMPPHQQPNMMANMANNMPIQNPMMGMGMMGGMMNPMMGNMNPMNNMNGMGNMGGMMNPMMNNSFMGSGYGNMNPGPGGMPRMKMNTPRMPSNPTPSSAISAWTGSGDKAMTNELATMVEWMAKNQTSGSEAVSDNAAVMNQPLTHSAENNRRFLGKVKKFDPQLGYGFLSCEETKSIFGRDVFIHNTQLAQVLGRDVNLETVTEDIFAGLKIEFSVGMNEKNMPQARDCYKLGETPSHIGPQKKKEEKEIMKEEIKRETSPELSLKALLAKSPEIQARKEMASRPTSPKSKEMKVEKKEKVKEKSVSLGDVWKTGSTLKPKTLVERVDLSTDALGQLLEKQLTELLQRQKEITKKQQEMEKLKPASKERWEELRKLEAERREQKRKEEDERYERLKAQAEERARLRKLQEEERKQAEERAREARLQEEKQRKKSEIEKEQELLEQERERFRREKEEDEAAERRKKEADDRAFASEVERFRAEKRLLEGPSDDENVAKRAKGESSSDSDSDDNDDADDNNEGNTTPFESMNISGTESAPNTELLADESMNVETADTLPDSNMNVETTVPSSGVDNIPMEETNTEEVAPDSKEVTETEETNKNNITEEEKKISSPKSHDSKN